MDILYIFIPVFAVGLAHALREDGVKLSGNGIVLGVCSGVAERCDMNVVVVRWLFILWSLCLGGGIITYIMAWCILPTRSR